MNQELLFTPSDINGSNKWYQIKLLFIELTLREHKARGWRENYKEVNGVQRQTWIWHSISISFWIKRVYLMEGKD